MKKSVGQSHPPGPDKIASLFISKSRRHIPGNDSQTYLYRPTATHKIEVNAETALEHGICFFGNRFSDVVSAMEKWEGDSWDGKIPLEVPDN